MSLNEIRKNDRFCQYLGDYTILTETAFSRKIYLDSRDISVAPHIMYEGRWEPWVTDFFIREIRPGARFIDLGANCGFYTLLAAHLTGPEGLVAAFEPQSRLAELLDRSVQVNGFNGYTRIVQAAAGRAPGEGSLRKFGALMGSASIEQHVDTNADVETIRVDTLTTLLGETGLDLTPSDQQLILKIDVEGFEYDAWLGARDWLKQWPNRTILLEFSPGRYDQHGSSDEGFFNLLIEDGHAITKLGHDSREQPFTVADIPSGDYVDLVLRPS